MGPFILISVCLAAGLLLNKITAPTLGKSRDAVATVLNAVVIYIALPAMTISQIHRLNIDSSLLIIASGPWLNFLAATLFWALTGKALGWSRQITGMMILCTGLGNTSFLGFPLIEAVLGKEALPFAVVSDQMGSFLVLSTLGIIVANFYGDARDGDVLGRVLRFPPFAATIFALLTRQAAFHPVVTETLDRLASLLSPLALMSVGSRLSLNVDQLREYRGKLLAGVSFKMVLIPALTMLTLALTVDNGAPYQRVMILESAMPAMITGYLVGAERGLDSRLGALLVSLGIGLALIAIPIWGWALRA